MNLTDNSLSLLRSQITQIDFHVAFATNLVLIGTNTAEIDTVQIGSLTMRHLIIIILQKVATKNIKLLWF